MFIERSENLLKSVSWQHKVVQLGSSNDVDPLANQRLPFADVKLIGWFGSLGTTAEVGPKSKQEQGLEADAELNAN